MKDSASFSEDQQETLNGEVKEKISPAFLASNYDEYTDFLRNNSEVLGYVTDKKGGPVHIFFLIPAMDLVSLGELRSPVHINFEQSLDRKRLLFVPIIGAHLFISIYFKYEVKESPLTHANPGVLKAEVEHKGNYVKKKLLSTSSKDKLATPENSIEFSFLKQKYLGPESLTQEQFLELLAESRR